MEPQYMPQQSRHEEGMAQGVQCQARCMHVRSSVRARRESGAAPSAIAALAAAVKRARLEHARPVNLQRLLYATRLLTSLTQDLLAETSQHVALSWL